MESSESAKNPDVSAEGRRTDLEQHELDAITDLVSKMHIPTSPQGLPEVTAVRRSSKAVDKIGSFSMSHDPNDFKGPSVKIPTTSLSELSSPINSLSPINSAKEKDLSLKTPLASAKTAGSLETVTTPSIKAPSVSEAASAKPKVTFENPETPVPAPTSLTPAPAKRRSLSMLIKTNTMPVKQMSFLLKNNDDSKLDSASYESAKRKAIELAQDLAAQKEEQARELKLKQAQDEEKAKRGKATSFGFHSIKGGLTIHDFKESKRKSCCYDPVTNHSKISPATPVDVHHHHHHTHLVPIESMQSLVSIGKHLHLDTPGVMLHHEPLMKIEEDNESKDETPLHSRPATKHGVERSGLHSHGGLHSSGEHSATPGIAHDHHDHVHHEHHDPSHGPHTAGGHGPNSAHHPHHHHLHHRLHEVISDQLIDQKFGWQRTANNTSRNSQKNLPVDIGSGSLPPTVGKPKQHSHHGALTVSIPETPAKIPLLLTPLAAKTSPDKSPKSPNRKSSLTKQKSLNKLHTDDAPSFVDKLIRQRSQLMGSFSSNPDDAILPTNSDDNISLGGGSFMSNGESLAASLASITSLNSMSQYKFLKVKVAKPVEDAEGNGPSMMSEHIAKLDQTVLSHLDRAVYVDPNKVVTWREVVEQPSVSSSSSVASILQPNELERQMNLRTGKLLNAYRPWSKARSMNPKEIDFAMIKEAFSRQPTNLALPLDSVETPSKSSLRRKSRKPAERKPREGRRSLSRGNSTGSVSSEMSGGDRSRVSSARLNDLKITINEDPQESGRISPTESVTSILTSSVNGMDAFFTNGNNRAAAPSSRKNVMPIVINVVKIS